MFFLFVQRHPYVLCFVENLEIEDSILVVAERAIPIEIWLKSKKAGDFSLDLETTWGLKCILEALNFLHTKCVISHCYINLHSCFYTRNGDWKIGLFDLACKCVSQSSPTCLSSY